jgi:hypothetical protein
VGAANITRAGTRHFKSLLQLADLLETKADLGPTDDVVHECVMLLERKIMLLKQIHRFD